MPRMPIRRYRTYKECTVVKDGSLKVVYVPTRFCRIGRELRVLKDSFQPPNKETHPEDWAKWSFLSGAPDREIVNPEQWAMWTVESVGEMVMGGSLSEDLKHQVRPEI